MSGAPRLTCWVLHTRPNECPRMNWRKTPANALKNRSIPMSSMSGSPLPWTGRSGDRDSRLIPFPNVRTTECPNVLISDGWRMLQEYVIEYKFFAQRDTQPSQTKVWCTCLSDTDTMALGCYFIFGECHYATATITRVLSLLTLCGYWFLIELFSAIKTSIFSLPASCLFGFWTTG